MKLSNIEMAYNLYSKRNQLTTNIQQIEKIVKIKTIEIDGMEIDCLEGIGDTEIKKVIKEIKEILLIPNLNHRAKINLKLKELGVEIDD